MTSLLAYWITQSINFLIYFQTRSVIQLIAFYALLSCLFGVFSGKKNQQIQRFPLLFYAFFAIIYLALLAFLNPCIPSIFDHVPILVFWSLFWLFSLFIIYYGEQKFVASLAQNSPIRLAIFCMLVNLPTKYFALQALPMAQKIAYFILPITTVATYHDSPRGQAFFRALVEILFAFSIAILEFKSPATPLVYLTVLSIIFLLVRKKDYQLIKD